MSRRMRNGGQEEMRGDGSSKRRLLLVDVELRKRGNLKRDNCETE